VSDFPTLHPFTQSLKVGITAGIFNKIATKRELNCVFKGLMSYSNNVDFENCAVLDGKVRVDLQNWTRIIIRDVLGGNGWLRAASVS
jgi:hypothetical protein